MTFRFLIPVLGSLLLLGCGGGTSSEPGRMSVTLVDGPIDGFDQVNLDIQSVEIKGEGGWITLGTPNRVVNLLDLTGGVSQTLASGASLPAGSYGQMRLLLGPNNTVKPTGQALQALKVPSGLQTGVKLIVNFQVQAGTTKDVWIDFDAARSVQAHQTGNGAWMLRPTVWAYDKVATGSISGTLTTGGAPLAGAVVTAQVMDGSGVPQIIRRTLSGASGAYQLDLLPLGAPIHVVSQPLVGGTAYLAQASAAQTLTGSAPTGAANFTFTAAPTTGGVAGSVQAQASTEQSDEVELLQTLSAGTGSGPFVVRGVLAAVGSQETFAFTGVPVGDYRARLTRSTLAPDGTTTATRTTGSPFQVSAGQTTTLNF